MQLNSRREIRILHVDDDPSVTDLTGTFLEREDDRFAVETAPSAEEGLQRISDRPPDCVVSDYNMPDIDGLEFLQAVREEYPDLPFILFTGKGSETVASDAIAAGVTDYLQKESGTEQYELLANRIRNAVRARRETERADRQEQLMRLTEFAGDTGGFELDTETGEIFMTDGVRRLIDLSAGADLSLTEAIDLYHSEERADIRQTIDRACQTGEQTQGTWRLQTQDGNERIVDVTFTPATDDDTEILRGAIHDVTDRHERQQELKSERRFIEQALDTLDDLFYVLNTDGTLRRWNERLPELTGYTDRDLAEMQAIELFPEDERETMADAIETTLADGQARVEADLHTADGERLPCEFTGAQLTDEDGTVTGLVGTGRDLTERRQRERRLNAFLEHSTDRLSVLDAEGCYTFVSPSVEPLFGYDPAELIGESGFEYIHPEDRADTRATFEQILSDPDGIHSVEYRYRDDEGSWRWVESRATNRLDDPAIEGIVINSREITDRKQREQELAQTRDLMTNMEQLADVGAWEYDAETETLTPTDGARRVHGLEPGADLTLEAAFETFHPDDRDLLEDRFTECLETGEPYEVDVRLTTPDGDQRWITARAERVTDHESGAVVRGYIQDITDRKNREQELQELKRQYQTLVENFPNGAVFLFDADRRYVRAGGAELEAVGMAPEEIEGATAHDIFPEQLADELVGYYNSTLDGNSHTFTRAIGGKTYRTWTVPVQISDEDIDYGLGMSQNVTDQIERRQELERQNERLEEFASIVSHDLLSPLTVVEGHLELARETCESDHLTQAADALDRSQALIDDLLELARGGETVGEPEPVALTDVAERSWETVATGSALLETHATRTAQADRSRLQELFENLYRNSVEHGGDDVTVSVGEMDDGFYVADTGPGIPESEREEVFEAGYSTSDGGTGFGLRIVEQVADAHGWEVAVTESERGGVRFEFTGVEKGE